MADLTEQQLLSQDPEVLGLQRQRQLANLLTGQAFNQPQGQMISGRYVAPSGLQQALPMINAAIGGLTNANLDTKQQDLAAALRGQKAEAYTTFQDLMSKPETRGKAIQYAAGNQYLQPIVTDMMKMQKLGADENLVMPNFSGGAPINIASGGAKIAPEVRQAMQLLGINKPLEQLNPQELQAVENKAIQFKRAGATNVNVNTGQHGFDNTVKLGESFKSEPIYKAHQEVSQAYQQVNNALSRNDAAGDMAAAIKINKMLDPTSVVRESEAARIAASRGILDTLGQLTDKVYNGDTLTPQQRTQYRSLVKDFYDISGTQYNETRNKYSQIGQQNQLGGVETMLGQPWKPPVEVKWGQATVEGKK